MAGTTQAGHQESVNGLEFRRTCGKFATGVTVVTTVAEGETHGMTANAFMAVSLDPPLVLVSVDRRARMCDCILRSGRYGVSVLTRLQKPHCRHFAGRREECLEPRFSWVDGVPLLEGALAHLVVRVVDPHVAGDHVLFIGRVEYLSTERGCHDEAPLLFQGGRFAESIAFGQEAHSGFTWHEVY